MELFNRQPENLAEALGERMIARAQQRGFQPMTPEEATRVAKVRESFHDFCEYCFRTENDQPITQQPFHDEWHDFETSHKRTVLWAPVEHGKSKQRTIYYTLWRLGHDPNELHAIISAEAVKQAFRFLAEIKKHIESNVYLHRVFPDLRKGDYWRQAEIIVDRTIITRDPTIQALGVNGTINGSRLHVVSADDILSFKNTYSRAQRLKTLHWFENEVLTRMLPDGRVHMRGTVWLADDALHELVRSHGFASKKYKAVDATVANVREGRVTRRKILWPDMWTTERLQERLVDIGGVAFARTMLNQVRDDESSRFPEAVIEKALELGRGVPLLYSYRKKPNETISTGADLATSDKVSLGDVQALATLLLSSGGIYRPLWLETDAAGRWSVDEHINRVQDHSERYRGTVIRVESNLGQKFFAKFSKLLTSARIETIHTGREKRDPHLGVDGISLMMEQGRFLIPNEDTPTTDPAESHARDEVAALVQEMRDYDPEARHIPDRLAAMWFAFTAMERKRAKFKIRGGGRGRQGGEGF